jgi:diguanylate cyclase (GGDEF)-like protein/PAS domain S-box-containing protein
MNLNVHTLTFSIALLGIAIILCIALIAWKTIDQRKSVDKERRAYLNELETMNQQLEEAIAQANEMAVQAVAAEANVKENEIKLQTILETSPDGIAITSLEGLLQYSSARSVSMWGYEANDEILGKNFKEFVHPGDHERLAHLFSQLQSGQPAGAVELLGLRKDHSQFYFEANANLLHDANHQPVGFLLIERDITERRRLQQKLEHQATTDSLTGAINRRRFLEIAQIEMKRSRRLAHPISLALIDIDHFKHINDTYGHAMGDQALIMFSKICETNFREIDVFARFGGDEFALLMPETNQEQADLALQRVFRILSNYPLMLGNQAINITLSAGIAELNGVVDTLDTLLERADRALYQAKETGRNRVCLEEIPSVLER